MNWFADRIFAGLFFLALSTSVSADDKTYWAYENYGNDHVAVSLILKQDKSFSLSCDFGDGIQQFKGSFKEWENVFDLKFHNPCKPNTDCTLVEVLKYLFATNQFPAQTIPSLPGTVRITKNADLTQANTLYICGARMKLAGTPD